MDQCPSPLGVRIDVGPGDWDSSSREGKRVGNRRDEERRPTEVRTSSGNRWVPMLVSMKIQYKRVVVLFFHFFEKRRRWLKTKNFYRSLLRRPRSNPMYGEESR